MADQEQQQQNSGTPAEVKQEDNAPINIKVCLLALLPLGLSGTKSLVSCLLHLFVRRVGWFILSHVSISSFLFTLWTIVLLER
jgi:hypothetical protein